ncbi:MAG TPA: T9SS type A sorting domain-containing protein [Bacteroidia bacterium]|nr:T9SS type A sorting domain-containing protein [Bacteroidia bacterium]
MKKNILVSHLFVFIALFPFAKNCNAQNDTLRIMVQNTLHFGDGCQGTQAFLDKQLKAEVQYINPDLIGLDKVQVIKLTNSDPYGISPVWFADSIVSQALDAAYPGRYAYCTLTDQSQATDNDMSILFYNQNKIGFLTVKTLYVGEEDIDLYKLFYKDPNLNTTHDTTYLYAVLCHTISGSSSSGRDGQATTVINSLKAMFSHLPNLIYMGDFNTHNSTEPGYELITQTSDTNYLFYDPPFHPDNKLTYQIDWTTNPSQAAAELTTTTRSGSNPNSCGNTGGGYDWFDHVFLSRNIINNYDYIRYIPNSWKSVGNDGKRVGIDINDSITNGKNLSAPSSVLNAEWQFSDKYPVTVELGVTYNTHINTGSSQLLNNSDIVKVNNPVKDAIIMGFSSSMIGKTASADLYDICGRLLHSYSFVINSTTVKESVTLIPGIYILRLQSGSFITTKKLIAE